MKKVTIRKFEDLVEVFPSLTTPQICWLYKRTLLRIKDCDNMLAPEALAKRGIDPKSLRLGDERIEPIFEKLGFYQDCADFLAGYLARCYCNLCGFSVH